MFQKWCLILIAAIYAVSALDGKQTQKLTQDEVNKRLEELTKTGSLETFFKNLKVPAELDEVTKSLQNVTISKEFGVRNAYFASKINETLECAKITLKEENPITGRPAIDPWRPKPFDFMVEWEDYLWTNLTLSDVRATDHLAFNTLKLTLSSSYLQETEVYVEKAVFSADYEGAMKWFGVVSTKGKGKLRIELKDVLIKSKLQYNSDAPPMILKNTYNGSIGKTVINITNLHKDEDINKWLNEFLTKSTNKMLNLKMDIIAEILSEHVVDMLNRKFGKLTMIDFLAKLATFECNHKIV